MNSFHAKILESFDFGEEEPKFMQKKLEIR